VEDVAEICARLSQVPRQSRPPSAPVYKESWEEWVRWTNPLVLKPRELYLVVDATGVGLPVVDLFKRLDLGHRSGLIGVTVTGGFESREAERRRARDGWYRQWHVPKRELVGVMQSLIQSERLKVSAKLAEGDALLRELQTFRIRVTEAANETYGAWREGDHDDTVLAVAFACWAGERVTTQRMRFL